MHEEREEHSPLMTENSAAVRPNFNFFSIQSTARASALGNYCTYFSFNAARKLLIISQPTTSTKYLDWVSTNDSYDMQDYDSDDFGDPDRDHESVLASNLQR